MTGITPDHIIIIDDFAANSGISEDLSGESTPRPGVEVPNRYADPWSDTSLGGPSSITLEDFREFFQTPPSSTHSPTNSLEFDSGFTLIERMPSDSFGTRMYNLCLNRHLILSSGLLVSVSVIAVKVVVSLVTSDPTAIAR
jgi:hypothetical protein